MNSPRIRIGVVLIGAIMLSAVSALAEDDLSLEPVVVDGTVTCHTSVDPGFMATIEDRSNDKGFIAAFEDISNDSGFLEPVDPGLDVESPISCPPVVPLPETEIAP